MYSSSVATSNPVVEQFNINKQNLSNLKRDISPLVHAASELAQTARDMRAHVVATTGSSKALIFSPQGDSIQSKQLIKLLDGAKDTLKSFASKAKSLDQEVDFFSNHQDGLFQGNVAAIPQTHKVNWCTGQVEKILKRASKLVLKEMEKLRTQKLGTMQLHMAKEQAIGQMVMAEENYAALMLVFGKNLLDKGRIDSLDSIFGMIRETTSEELQEIANEVFAPDQLSFLTYLPK